MPPKASEKARVLVEGNFEQISTSAREVPKSGLVGYR